MPIPLVVETGSGVAGANTYSSLDEANAYLASRGHPALADGDALVKGTLWLENAYRGRWKGYRVHRDQGLAWPRCNWQPQYYATTFANITPAEISYLYDVDGFLITPSDIPRAVKEACCEAGRLAAAGFNFNTVSNAAVRGGSRTIDKLSKSESFAGAVTKRPNELLAIDQILLGLLIAAPGATFGNMKVMRG